MENSAKLEAEAKTLSSLPLLQNMIKRDPAAYESQFSLQYNHLMADLDDFKTHPHRPSKEFHELITFVAQTSVCYSKVAAVVKGAGTPFLTGHRGGSITARLGNCCSKFVESLMDLLARHKNKLHSSTRQTVVTALIMLRKKNQVSGNQLLPLWFDLFELDDKQLRLILSSHVVRDLCNKHLSPVNANATREMRTYLLSQLRSTKAVRATRSLCIIIELYRKRIWVDDKVVNAIANCTLSEDAKVTVLAAKFLLGETNGDLTELDSDIEEDDAGFKAKIGCKKSRGKRAKEAKEKQASVRKAQRIARRKGDLFHGTSFTAIDLLYDPQHIAETIFARVKANVHNFNSRLVMLNVITRLVGRHQLFIIDLYSYIQRYLNPKQKQVSQILAFIAQASHDLVPPQELFPIIKTITDGFVTDHQPANIISLGLNSIREIAFRSPLSVTEDRLSDLINYRSHKDKGVAMAAKSLINLFRDLYPALLQRKFRGKKAAMLVQRKEDYKPVYGGTKVVEYIEGSEVLLKGSKFVSTDGEEPGMSDEEDEENCESACDICCSDVSIMEMEASDNVEDVDVLDKSLGSVEFEGLRQNESPTSSQHARKRGYMAMMNRVWDEKDFKKLRRTQKMLQSDGVDDELDNSSQNSSLCDGDEEDESDKISSYNRPDIVEPDALQRGKSHKIRNDSAGKNLELERSQKSLKKKRVYKGILKHGSHNREFSHSKPSKVQSRNKPMVMQKQSRRLNYKRQQDARTKLENVKKHIRTLRKKTGKKVRRRRQ